MTITAEIIAKLSVLPRFVDFGKIKPESSHQRDIRLQNNSAAPITITEIILKPKQFSSISPDDPFTLKPGETKTLVLTLAPGTFNRTIYGSMNFKTNLTDLPQKTTRFRAYIVDENK